jgi:hypothetical protein
MSSIHLPGIKPGPVNLDYTSTPPVTPGEDHAGNSYITPVYFSWPLKCLKLTGVECIKRGILQ